MFKKLGILAIVIFGLFYFHAMVASAAGLTVFPARLELKLGASGVTSRLEVTNPTNEVLLVEVFEASEKPGFKANPELFSLEPGQAQEVLVSFARSIGSGRGAEVAVVASSKNGSSAFGGGVKIPVLLKSATVDFRSMSFWLQLIELGLIIKIVYRISQTQWSKKS